MNGVDIMPWCPNCQREHKQAVTCPDCDTKLIENLSEEEGYLPFFQAENKVIADKLVNYYKYSGLESKVDFDEENEVYIVSVPSDQYKNAKKLYQAFYFVELSKADRKEKMTTSTELNEDMTENNEYPMESSEDDRYIDSFVDASMGDISDSETEGKEEELEALETFEDEEEIQPKSTEYIMKADQYKDLTSTVFTFVLFGVAGLIVVFLNIAGIINILNGWFAEIILGALCLFFLYIGFSTHKKAKKVKEEIAAENKRTEEINQWLKENITEEFFKIHKNDSISEELNYIRNTELIHEMLVKEFGEQNPAYLDRLIEEYYSNTFDQ
jgi:hypothetical protein